MNAKATIEKTKPKLVFLDTQQFCANKLSFKNSNFTRLGALVKSGHARVLLTEIVDREVRRHIRTDLADARKQLDKKFGGLFQNLEGSPTPPPLADDYWAKAEKEILEQFDEWCRRVEAEILPVTPKLVRTVFDWYFASDGPFDAKKRKAEFPDAFSIACINEWAAKQSETVYLLRAYPRTPAVRNAVMAN